MSISGNLLLSPVEIPLLIRAAFHVNLTDQDGVAVDLTDRTVTAYLLKNPDDLLSEAVLTKVSTVAGEVSILSPATGGRILVTYSTVTALSVQRAYTLVVKVVETSTGDVMHVQAFNAVALNVAPSQNFDVGDSYANAVLSTRFVNVRSFTTVVGGLDALVTLTETVGVIVKFFVSDEPQEWTLLAGTTASDGVTYQRPLDYAASTNEKVWKRTA